MLQKFWCLEGLGDGFVKAGDYLIDLFFPRRFSVFAQSNGGVEFSKGGFNSFGEVVGNLEKREGFNKASCWGCTIYGKERLNINILQPF